MGLSLFLTGLTGFAPHGGTCHFTKQQEPTPDYSIALGCNPALSQAMAQTQAVLSRPAVHNRSCRLALHT